MGDHSDDGNFCCVEIPNIQVGGWRRQQMGLSEPQTSR